MSYVCTTQYLKKMDMYIFFVCQDVKKELERIAKLMKIPKLPKKLIEGFHGKLGEEKTFYMDDKEILFVGYGKKKICKKDELYDLYGSLGKRLAKDGKKIWIDVVIGTDNEVENQIVGWILGEYSFDKYKKKNEETKKENNISFYAKNKKVKDVIQHAIQEAIVQNQTRDLINEPANLLNSVEYVKYMKKHLHSKIKMRVLNDNELKKQGLNLILAVNSGSANPANLIILEYTSDLKYKKSPSICLIGKGVMFDTGGYSIKGGDFSDMKEDMAGSAIVYGVMNMIASNQFKGRYVGIMPIVENMVDAKATRPGDIIRSYNGKTVEITDTDAEGRLILADAIAYSENYNPKVIIDVATLTGAAAHMFGNKATAIMGTGNEMIHYVKKTGEDVKEHMWDLPMWEEYVDLTKSTVADYKNLTYSAGAGAIMGGAFLSNFVPLKEKNIQWIHMDIAGVDFLASPTSTRSAGALAGGFRTILHLANDLQEKR